VPFPTVIVTDEVASL
jgi:hypothetical protein